MNNDLISRSALKEAFEITQYNDYDDLKRTESLIDNAPTVEQPTVEWIPVSERLPEVSQRYFVYTKYDEVMTDFFMGDAFLQGNDIIAWMPLPEPYKKEGEEE